jgi:hypothetical protein
MALARGGAEHIVNRVLGARQVVLALSYLSTGQRKMKFLFLFDQYSQYSVNTGQIIVVHATIG